MRVRKLVVDNYRGIKHCEWVICQDFVCLIGPGDSTKTTLLDALGLALSPKYTVTFTDADFFNCDVDHEIVIEVVVSDLPDEIVTESAHGTNRAGIRSDGTLEHDPIDEVGVEECLIVRLTVDNNLEPKWEVVRPGESTGLPITASQRGRLGYFRVGDAVDAHLKWGRGSALTNLTRSRTEARNAVVEAQRQARTAIAALSGTPLHEAASIAHKQMIRLGSGPFSEVRPGLDPSFGSGSSALVLHDGEIPLTNFGLGTRRLSSLSVQNHAIVGRSIVAIDEVETGLDPHRLAHLVKYLKTQASAGDMQVFFTTHSPLVVEAISTANMCVVRCLDGETTVMAVPPELQPPATEVLQGFARARPSALLGHAVIVGEGATEVGFIRGLLSSWDSSRNAGEDNSITFGTVVTLGGGDAQSPPRSEALVKLGFPTFLMIDGDVTTNTDAIASARLAGVEVGQWSTGRALEDVLARTLPLTALNRMIDLAIEEHSEESVTSQLATHLEVAKLDSRVVEYLVRTYGETKTREAVARAAKGAKKSGQKQDSKSWFKREDRGEQLGLMIANELSSMPRGELHSVLGRLWDFVYKRAGAASCSDETKSD